MSNVKSKTAQSVGRIGELSVELELTGRNWLVGNFNSNIQNAAVYDLFAVKKNKKRLLRVKSYSLWNNDFGTIQYTAKKNGEIFLDGKLLNNLKNSRNLIKWQKSIGYVPQKIYFQNKSFGHLTDTPQPRMRFENEK